MRLLGAGDVRAVAGRLGVQPTKRLGQNFVVEPGTVRQIAGLAGPFGDTDVVLEVGPGLGSLTLALLEAAAPAGARVVAVEIDPVLAAELPNTVAERAPEAGSRISVVEADALRIGIRDLPAPPTVLAANLPYNVSVPVILHLLATFPTLERGVVMVQAEVADRMCAGPGGRVYGAPSAKLAWYATARPAGVVPRSVFWPVPNVDSKLVRFERFLGDTHQSPRPPEPGALGTRPSSLPALSRSSFAPVSPGERGGAGLDREAVDREAVFRVIDAAFGQRRKTLRAALGTWAGSAAMAEAVLRAAGVDPGARGESLGVAEFARIAAAAGVAGIAGVPRPAESARNDNIPES